mgnify:FL=1
MSNDAVQHFEVQPIRSACNPEKESGADIQPLR